MDDIYIPVAIDPAAKIVLQIKEIDVAGIGLHLIVFGYLLDGLVYDGRRPLVKEVIFEDWEHQLFQLSCIGNKHDQAGFAKEFVEKAERSGLDIGAFEVTFF